MKKITGFELKRVVDKSFKNRDGLRQLSDFVVNNYTKDLDDERKAELSADLAVGIAMGEILSRKDHILTGITIGAAGTLGALLTYKFVKKKKKNLRLWV